MRRQFPFNLMDRMDSPSRNACWATTFLRDPGGAEIPADVKTRLTHCLMLVAELNPHIGYENAAKISLAAGAIAEIARPGVVRAIDRSAAV